MKGNLFINCKTLKWGFLRQPQCFLKDVIVQHIREKMWQEFGKKLHNEELLVCTLRHILRWSRRMR
jgi:hypothetical protein